MVAISTAMPLLNRMARLWSKPLSIRGATLLVIAGYFALNVLGVLVKGWGPIYDWHTFLLMSILCVVLGYALTRSDSFSFLVIMAVSIYFILMILPKLTAYVWFPEQVHISHLNMLHIKALWSPYYPAGTGILSINVGLGFVVLGLMFFLSGVLAVNKMMEFLFSFKSFDNYINTNYSNISIYLLISFILFAAIQCYLTIWIGNSVYSDVLYGSDHKVVGVFTHLFSYKAIMLISLVYIFSIKEIRIFDIYVIFLMIFLYALASSLGGSRAMPYTMILYFSAALVSVYGNYVTYIGKYILFFLMIFFIIITTWPIGSYVRDNAIYERNKIENNSIQNDNTNISAIVKGLGIGKDRVDHNMIRILNRLCDLDYAILSVSFPYKSTIKDRYMNIGYELKSAINIIVPGKVFKNVNTNTAFLWPFVYGDTNIRLMMKKNYYQTIPWTMWGVSYAMFGWWGGIIFLFMSGFFLNAINIIMRIFSNRYLPFFLSFIFVSSFRFIGIMGIDDYISVIFNELLFYFVAFVFIFSIFALCRNLIENIFPERFR